MARDAESEELEDLVAIHRGVFLYGASGDGKSSLINAGLLPAIARRRLTPERIRVQPRLGEELVVERIARTEDDGDLLPSLLVPADDRSARLVVSAQAFEDRVRAVCADGQRPLLIFDQFEEVITLFEVDDAGEAQRSIARMLARLLRDDTLALKLLFAFREDYLGKVKRLLAAVPELVDQALHLAPLAAEKLTTIIRGPFDRWPGHFERELDTELTDRIGAALAERFGSSELSLSEVETVALRLWQSSDPGALLAARGVQGLLEDYLGEALDRFPADLRAAAITGLAQMVTAAGTRNVISAEDLAQRAREDDPGLSPLLLSTALGRLEKESRLIRRERRRETYLYEITSEFLVPWISGRREELRREQDRAVARRRYLVLGSIAGALLVVAAVVAVVALWALGQRADARLQASNATALGLASAATAITPTRPDIGTLLGLAAYRERPVVEARSAVLAGIVAAREPGIVGILHGHLAGVNAVASSPIAGMLATASDDQTVRLWSTRTHRQLGPALRGHRDRVFAVAFARDGRTIASGGADGTIRLWNRRTRAQMGPALAPRAGTIFGVAFSPDGRTLAAATGDGGVLLWDPRTRRRTGHALRSRPGAALAVAFAPDGRTIVTAGIAGVELWDVRTQRRLGTPVDRHFAQAVAFSPDGRVLARAGDDGIVTLCDPRTRKQLGALRAPAQDVTSLAFGPGGRRLVATAGRAVQIWDARSQRRVDGPLAARAGDITSAAFDGHTLAYAGGDGSIRLWEPSDEHALMSVLRGHTGTVSTVAFAPDGRTLATAGEDRVIRLWDVRARRPIGRPLVGHAGVVTGVAFASDGRVLASSSFDGTVRLWDPRTQRPLGPPLRADATTFVNDVDVDRAGGTLAAATSDGAIELWDVRTRALLGKLRLPAAGTASRASFSPDGATLASAGDDGATRLWDVASRRRLGRPMRANASRVTDVTFSPDGATLATGSDDGTVRLWDARTHQQRGTPLTGHGNTVNSVAFSPDGVTIASASSDGTIRLWDARTRALLGTPLDAHDGSVDSVAFSPDGRTLASGGHDKAARLWSGLLWRSEQELARGVCDLVGGGLTPSEWRQYSGGNTYRDVCG